MGWNILLIALLCNSYLWTSTFYHRRKQDFRFYYSVKDILILSLTSAIIGWTNRFRFSTSALIAYRLLQHKHYRRFAYAYFYSVTQNKSLWPIAFTEYQRSRKRKTETWNLAQTFLDRLRNQGKEKRMWSAHIHPYSMENT